MRTVKAFRALFAQYWLPAALYGSLLVGFGVLLWWQLGTLTGGRYSPSELDALPPLTNMDILRHPLNAPFTLLTQALSYLGHDIFYFGRLAATLFGLLTLTAFYWLVRYWHGERSAVFGTLVFGTSAWFLHTARLGTPDVLMCCLLALTACALWFKHSKQAFPVVLCLVLAACLLYVPGMVWFIGAGVAWQWKTIDRVFKEHLWMVTAGGFLLLAILAPLVLAIYHTPDLAKTWAGLPAGWPQPLTVAEHIARVPVQLVVRGPADPLHWLGRTAILNAFSVAMLALGVYVYAKHIKLVRTQLVGIILAIGTVLVGLGGMVSMSILIPFVYIVIAAGIGMLIDRWYTVFPRNPIAQGVGMTLLSLTVAASCWYGYRHYFVAWPQAPETKSVFTVDEPSI